MTALPECDGAVRDTSGTLHPCTLGYHESGPHVSPKVPKSGIARRRWELEQQSAESTEVVVRSDDDDVDDVVDDVVDDDPESDDLADDDDADPEPAGSPEVSERLRNTSSREAYIRSSLASGALPRGVEVWMQGAEAQLALTALWMAWRAAEVRGESVLVLSQDEIEALVAPRLRS